MNAPRILWTLFALAFFAATLCAQGRPGPAKDDPNKLPISKLALSKLVPDLCLVKYPITTSSPECQAYFNQGLGYYYSYVWIEAARSFETATKHDPQCAMAWWGLSKALEKWPRPQHTDALKKAKEFLPRAGHRETFLINARLAEKGMIDGVKPENRRKEAAKYLDELLTIYDDDEEGWFCRAQVADGPNANIPFYKALLRVNPLHPGAHHELVHHYENIRRPALGWPHAVGYMQSSPGIPHAFHMQAHLGMRIGKWEKTTDWSSRAIELQLAYHKNQGVKPNEDWQFSHHLETLIQALIHAGRFQEARAVKAECEKHGYLQRLHWFRLHVSERDWDEAAKIIEHFKKDKLQAAYLRAVFYLKKGDIDRALPEVNILAEAYPTKKNDRTLELRLWETQGTLQCAQGGADGGLKLLAKTVEKTKDDYFHHAWGHGAYYMESWGIAALKANRLAVAEEAFLESLAHDAGSIRGALGMQVVCERQGRTEEALRFAELAQRCWRKADPGRLETELHDLRQGYAQPVLFGIHTAFNVLPASVTHTDKIQVTLTMTNKTGQDLKFRYIACIQDHIELFDSKGQYIRRKQGAPISECPYIEVQIDAGKTVERTAQFDFGEYYSVSPGDYELAFKYDTRLMKMDGAAEPWVPWSATKLGLTVRN